MLPSLPAYRVEVAKELAEDFCDVPESVLGTHVRPLTPATFSMLMAIGSPFVLGRRQPMEGDVRNYLWFHSRLYGNCDAWLWRLRKWVALDQLTTRLTEPWRRWLGLTPRPHHYSIALTMAVDQIETFVERAFACAPQGTVKRGVPLACLEANLVHQFAATYGWAPEKTRHTPLRRLFQMQRCMRLDRGEDVKDPGYEKMLEAHLEQRNAELKAAREAAKN